MIKKIFCIRQFKNWSETGTTWSSIEPMDSNVFVNENGVIFTMENGSISLIEKENDNIGCFTVFIGRKIDNIGIYENANETWTPYTFYNTGSTITLSNKSYVSASAHTSSEVFDETVWLPNVVSNSYNEITFTGETKISLFRRYGKTNFDIDLYNPTWNSGYTMEYVNSVGLLQSITGEKVNTEGIQPLYKYETSKDGDQNTKIRYEDINNSESQIKYMSSGFTSDNSISGPNIKNENLFGFIEFPKTQVNIFIDRGFNSSFEKHLKIGTINNTNELENYGNGEFIIKES